MAKKGGLVGMETVMFNLNRQLDKMTVMSKVGMQEAVMLVRKDMETTPPKVPVDTGNLRASWFQEFVRNLKGGHALIFGFSANYAVFVHEKIGADVNWNREGSGPKFLQAALKRNSKEIVKLIGKSMKL